MVFFIIPYPFRSEKAGEEKNRDRAFARSRFASYWFQGKSRALRALAACGMHARLIKTGRASRAQKLGKLLSGFSITP